MITSFVYSVPAGAGFSIWDGGDGIQLWHKPLDANGETYMFRHVKVSSKVRSTQQDVSQPP